jgi:small subunit ribosomal protein S2
MSRAGRRDAPEGEDKPEPGIAADEPLAEWELEQLTSGDAAPAAEPVAVAAEPAAVVAEPAAASEPSA